MVVDHMGGQIDVVAAAIIGPVLYVFVARKARGSALGRVVRARY